MTLTQTQYRGIAVLHIALAIGFALVGLSA